MNKDGLVRIVTCFFFIDCFSSEQQSGAEESGSVWGVGVGMGGQCSVDLCEGVHTGGVFMWW